MLEFIKLLFDTEPLDNFKVQKASQKDNSSSVNEEKEFIVLDVLEEDEEFFV